MDCWNAIRCRSRLPELRTYEFQTSSTPASDVAERVAGRGCLQTRSAATLLLMLLWMRMAEYC